MDGISIKEVRIVRDGINKVTSCDPTWKELGDLINKVTSFRSHPDFENMVYRFKYEKHWLGIDITKNEIIKCSDIGDGSFASDLLTGKKILRDENDLVTDELKKIAVKYKDFKVINYGTKVEYKSPPIYSIPMEYIIPKEIDGTKRLKTMEKIVLEKTRRFKDDFEWYVNPTGWSAKI